MYPYDVGLSHNENQRRQFCGPKSRKYHTGVLQPAELGHCSPWLLDLDAWPGILYFLLHLDSRPITEGAVLTRRR